MEPGLETQRLSIPLAHTFSIKIHHPVLLNCNRNQKVTLITLDDSRQTQSGYKGIKPKCKIFRLKVFRIISWQLKGYIHICLQALFSKGTILSFLILQGD